ncbi:lipopolysaccharide/colanic/teichoic acid biosynthesis glycosyltransferase [Sagittula marina]|uniref:Lipopolysaccharide/colanic/teichoic acid biosynthesis glycosyltransferase n=1 Tax=Sagittula marina TaxID=943940 RepID=A0A7W6DSM8_9RHOB|nr:sugar transferase [Sagittula marina]MBB3988446.1 lipopolysaccharide/colanic/teichoic acid biosynthesis glycosyltransferase [Sagittula marina]
MDTTISNGPITARTGKSRVGGSPIFFLNKRIFDVVMSLFLLPVLVVVAVLLLVLNPFYNKGRLFYTQRRMGRDCQPFTALKFRSMIDVAKISRDMDCPLEIDRITRLGSFMRKSRVDELPQLINVLKGDMSLIGPRPDYYDHAVKFLTVVPGYRERHSVRPGISGLAQTELGYIEGVEATRRKVRADLIYIAKTNYRMEAWIFWRTLYVIMKRGGA